MSDRAKGKVFVAIQFALLALIAFDSTTWNWNAPSQLRFITMTVALVGLAILALSFIRLGKGLTANPVPSARAELRTTGVYGIVRHPIYLALILIMSPKVLDSGQVLSIVGFLGLIVLLNIKARFEERLLLARFAGYAEYAARVGRLFPGVGRIRQS